MLTRRNLLAATLAASAVGKPAFAAAAALKLAVGLHLDWEQIRSELEQRVLE